MLQPALHARSSFYLEQFSAQHWIKQSAVDSLSEAEAGWAERCRWGEGRGYVDLKVGFPSPLHPYKRTPPARLSTSTQLNSSWHNASHRSCLHGGKLNYLHSNIKITYIYFMMTLRSSCIVGYSAIRLYSTFIVYHYGCSVYVNFSFVYISISHTLDGLQNHQSFRCALV